MNDMAFERYLIDVMLAFAMDKKGFRLWMCKEGVRIEMGNLGHDDSLELYSVRRKYAIFRRHFTSSGHFSFDLIVERFA
jgi:hypothetical protein